MKTLIFSDQILEPPTVISCFRQLTFYIHYDYRDFDAIVIESKKENWDFVWKFLKTTKSHDFIYDFVRPEDREVGLRVSDSFEYAPTIQAPYINERNIFNILRAVSYN